MCSPKVNEVVPIDRSCVLASADRCSTLPRRAGCAKKRGESEKSILCNGMGRIDRKEGRRMRSPPFNRDVYRHRGTMIDHVRVLICKRRPDRALSRRRNSSVGLHALYW